MEFCEGVPRRFLSQQCHGRARPIQRWERLVIDAHRVRILQGPMAERLHPGVHALQDPVGYPRSRGPGEPVGVGASLHAAGRTPVEQGGLPALLPVAAARAVSRSSQHRRRSAWSRDAVTTERVRCRRPKRRGRCSCMRLSDLVGGSRYSTFHVLSVFWRSTLVT